MAPIISLIIATYGRYTCLEALLESLTHQNISRDEFEVIIVDQNDNLDVGSLVNRFSFHVDIHWIRSIRRGLSCNRNKGIHVAKGRYIAFPDDDCIYYSDTLRQIIRSFRIYDVDVLIGRVYNRDTGRNAVRYWSTCSKRLSRINFYWNFASVVIFTKKPGLFDERLGAGQHYGSCEDADWIYSALKNHQNILYVPEIEVWHPDPDNAVPGRTESYSRGFGGFCRKNMDFPILFLFCFSLGSNLVRSILNFFLNKKAQTRNALFSCYWRLKAFGEWPRGPEYGTPPSHGGLDRTKAPGSCSLTEKEKSS